MKWWWRFGKRAINRRLLFVGNNYNNGLNGNNNLNNNGRFDGIIQALPRQLSMKTYKNLYQQVYSLSNLVLAWRKARKGKTRKDYVIEFEKNLLGNLLELQKELLSQIYGPKPLKTFILRDPKTRKISKSDFRDRIIHHAIINVLEPIFDKSFIYDSYANREGKGNLKAVERFRYFMRKVSENGDVLENRFNDNNFVFGFCLKADIKHYFQEVNHEILLKIIGKKIKDERVMWLIKKILKNNVMGGERGKGMPLGNLTSQFFANVYLNELDYFVKHKLKIRYYIRYVDDFVILHLSREQLRVWKEQINEFLEEELKLRLHSEKSRIIPTSKGIDFVGFRNFYYFKLLRRRSVRKMFFKIKIYKNNRLTYNKLFESFFGWAGYAKWADTYELRKIFVISLMSIKYKNL